MKPNLLYSLSLIIFLACYSSNPCFAITRDTIMHIKKSKKQKNPRVNRLQRLEKRWKPSYDDCVFTDQYTIAQRLKKYPFSKAVKILAVSYHGGAQPNSIIYLDSPKVTLPEKEDPLKRGLVITNDSLDYSTLIEVKTLGQNQINRLTNIIFNTDYKKKVFNQTTAASCFEPRNAFIFLDKNGKVIDCLEICFTCERYSSKSDRLNIGAVCTQKYDILRKYFTDIGIKYGTKKNMHYTD